MVPCARARAPDFAVLEHSVGILHVVQDHTLDCAGARSRLPGSTLEVAWGDVLGARFSIIECGIIPVVLEHVPPEHLSYGVLAVVCCMRW